MKLYVTASGDERRSTMSFSCNPRKLRRVRNESRNLFKFWPIKIKRSVDILTDLSMNFYLFHKILTINMCN